MKVLVAADGECSLTKELLEERVGKFDKIIVADGALRHIHALGLTPDYIVGDLDSVDRSLLAGYKNAIIEEYPKDKDKTDLQIAAEKALSFLPSNLVFIGIFGGRVDHQLGNLFLLSTFQVDNIRVEDKNFSCFVMNHTKKLQLSSGSGFSLIPLTQYVHGVTITGAKWNLSDRTLSIGAPTAICNEFLDGHIEISLKEGSLLVICNNY